MYLTIALDRSGPGQDWIVGMHEEALRRRRKRTGRRPRSLPTTGSPRTRPSSPAASRRDGAARQRVSTDSLKCEPMSGAIVGSIALMRTVTGIGVMSVAAGIWLQSLGHGVLIMALGQAFDT